MGKMDYGDGDQTFGYMMREFIGKRKTNKAKREVKQKMHKKRIYHIAPIRSVENEIYEDCSYIFCTMREDIPTGDNICTLHFMDTLETEHSYVFSRYHAEKLVDFLEESSTDEIFVCCDAGESRSAGIVAALIENESSEAGAAYIWDGDEYNPNIHVYNLMKNVLEKACP